MTPYYDDGTVTIWHGDCREIDAWDIAGGVMVTDPPYGIHKSRRGRNAVDIAGERRTGRSSSREIPREHVELRDEILRRWGARPALVFGYWRAPRPLNTQMRLIWDKCNLGMGGVGVWRPCDEEIYLLHWPNKQGEGASEPAVIRHHYPARNLDEWLDHPTPKPIALMKYLIDRCPIGVVVDPFMGSGSTLVAAKSCGRKAIGVELEERYCEIAAKRCAQGVLWEASA